jgi:hypothetical protein
VGDLPAGGSPSQAGGAAPPPPPPLSAEASAALAALERVGAGELARLADPASGTVLARAAQAEVDRRSAREARRQAQQQAQARGQHVAALEQQERETRATDVYRAAELRDQIDAARAQEQFVGGLVSVYDQATLDPLLGAVPEAERAGVLAAVAPGADALEGRRQVVAAALQRLEQAWRADEQAKLRANATFRKQVLAEARAGRNGRPRSAGGWAPGPGGVLPDLPEPADQLGPELLVGTPGGAPPPTMNDWLRSQMRRG